jgi:gliding motility-associated-like protein
MTRRALIIGWLAVLASLAGSRSEAFVSLQKVPFVLQVTLSSGTANLVITADPLPPQAFFGKNVVIPMSVSSDPAPLDTKNLKIEIIYQLLDNNGQAIGGLSLAPVTLTKDTTRANTLHGAAIISRDDLTSIGHGGRLQYSFRARQAAGDTILGKQGVQRFGAGSGPTTTIPDPFEVAIIDTLVSPISPDGITVSVPDTYIADGETSVAFGVGALSRPGTLVIHQENPQGFPAGPKGLLPTVVYTFTLQGTTLQKTAQLTLSYASDVDGKLTGTKGSPADLAPFFLDEHGWRLLSRPQLDTTRHTVTAVTPHFSTFALFASGPVTAASLRPLERIITPNGDGKNDTATFSGLTADEDVHLFDIRGRRVRTLHGPNAVWDGKGDDGRIVESGVYIYQYKSQGDRVSGVIVVAK